MKALVDGLSPKREDLRNIGTHTMYAQFENSHFTPKIADIKPLLDRDMKIDVKDYREKPLSLTYRSTFMPYSYNIHVRT